MDALSAWFTSMGIPPLMGGALLSVAALLVFKTIFRSRSDQPLEQPSPLQALRTKGGRRSSAGASLNVPPEIRAEALALTLAGRKIDAIKLVREATGCGLRESKDYVEALCDFG